jgi:hypothetical protein
MAHAQKPDFVFRRNGRVYLNRRGRQFSRLLAAEVCASALVMLDTPRSEVVWRVLATNSIRQFPLHFPSGASLCAITFQLDSKCQVTWNMKRGVCGGKMLLSFVLWYILKHYNDGSVRPVAVTRTTNRVILVGWFWSSDLSDRVSETGIWVWSLGSENCGLRSRIVVGYSGSSIIVRVLRNKNESCQTYCLTTALCT